MGVWQQREARRSAAREVPQTEERKGDMIELDAVERSFGDRRVLEDGSVTVASGGMTGVVGGNGAGKTTTMRIILGVLAANSGLSLIHI